MPPPQFLISILSLVAIAFTTNYEGIIEASTK